MFKGRSLAALVGILVLVSVLVILLEWNAVHSIAKDAGGLGSGEGVGGMFRGLRKRIPAGITGSRLRGNAGVVDSPGAVSQPPVSFPTPPEVRHSSCVDR